MVMVNYRCVCGLRIRPYAPGKGLLANVSFQDAWRAKYSSTYRKRLFTIESGNIHPWIVSSSKPSWRGYQRTQSELNLTLC